jgi:DNA primase
MRYPRDFIEKVVSATNIVDIISQHTVLKNRGKDLWGQCPFPDHKEKTPSFHVSPEKQLYHCFGCKKGGNVFTFLEHFQGLNFSESLEFLAQKAHLSLPVLSETQQVQINAQDEKRKRLIEITRWAQFYFTESLKRSSNSNPIYEYLKKRGLTKEIIDEFQIGYAPNEWDGFIEFLKKKGFSLNLAEEAGLILAREDGSGFYDRFRDRLMFTISNTMGNPIAFGGRVLDQSLPKYINSPETPIYHKGNVLYGLYQTGRYIRAEEYALVVEGYMDLVSLYQFGIKNVVAPLGTALTLDQCRILTRFTKNVVVLFDSDEAGQAAMEKSLPLLFEAGCYPKGLLLTETKDPDEFIRTYGAQALREKIEKAPDLFSLLIGKWMQGFQGEPTDKMRVLHQIKPIIGTIKEISLRNLYINELAQRMRVDRNWIYGALQIQAPAQSFSNNKAGSASSQRSYNSKTLNTQKTITQTELLDVQNELEGDKISLRGTPKVELLLLALAFTGERSSWDQILHADSQSLFTHKGVKRLFEKAVELSGQSLSRSANLVTLITNEILNLDLFTAAASHLPTHDPDAEAKLLVDCLRKIRMSSIDVKVKQIAEELKQDPTAEKYEQLSSLQRERMKILEKT